jgi:hypothetical protein
MQTKMLESASNSQKRAYRKQNREYQKQSRAKRRSTSNPSPIVPQIEVSPCESRRSLVSSCREERKVKKKKC